MSRVKICLCWLIIPYLSLVNASASLYSSHWHLHGPTRDSSLDQFSRSRRERRLALLNSVPSPYLSTATHLVARKENTKKRKHVEPEVLQEEPTELSFDDLGPIGKVVASVTEVGVAVLWNYCSGYMTGWIAGTALGIPGFFVRPVEPGVQQVLMTELKGRWVRMNVRSVRFGKSFGGISAIFKGSDVAVRRLRYGKDDEWNDILGSAIAGALFARKGKHNLNLWQSKQETCIP